MNDYTRRIISENLEDSKDDNRAIALIATTDISEYLIRKKKRMLNSMFAPLKSGGVYNLFKLCVECEIEQDNNQILSQCYVHMSFYVQDVLQMIINDSHSQNGQYHKNNN